jgi:hypothetical protein
MIGQRVESRPQVQIAAIVFFLLSAAFIGIACLARSSHAAIFAILPIALGIAAVVTSGTHLAFEITNEGLAFEEPDLGLVRYTELRGVTAPVSRTRNPGDDFAIQLYHTAGVVRIPSGHAVSARDLYDFLVERLPPLDPADPDRSPSSLRSFIAQQIDLFGAEKVFVYHARPFPPLSSHSRKLGYAVAVICAAVAWCLVGIVLEATKSGDGAVWGGFGCLTSFVALLFAFSFSRGHSAGRPSNWRDACVVVSPGGIAIVQGKLRGKMRWDELRSIDYPAKPRFGISTHGGARSGLGLLTDGAYFIIGDLYVRPLADIRRVLHQYWGGRDAN